MKKIFDIDLKQENKSFEVFSSSSQIHNEDESSSLSSSSSDGSPNERADAQENTRLVTQFHFKKWKDMDVPERSDTLIDLIFKMNEEWRLDNERAPIVVHCT